MLCAICSKKLSPLRSQRKAAGIAETISSTLMLAAGSECRYILHLPISSASVREDLRQFLRRNHLELRVCAICGFLIRTPAAELGGVAEAIALHVIVCNFDH